MITTNIEQNESGKKAIFNISDELSLNNVETLKTEMQNTLEQCNSFHFTLSNINNLDISGIQLIHAFALKAKAQNKAIKFDMDIAENTKKILLYAGLNDFTNQYTLVK